MPDKFYITTTLPYVNADPHIGFAAEILKADCIARYQRMKGKEVFFNTGTDEHGVKIYRKAAEAGMDPKEYCDGYADKFNGLKDILDLSYNSFIRTTDEKHIKAAQRFWELCDANGDIYKKQYKVKYCVGCELERTDSELDENGRCPLHPNKDLETIDEENYFFRFSKYQERLLKLYEEHPEFVLPDYRRNEIKAFVERGLEDFSISRLREKMPWGVPVPGDNTQVMYVWFDALVNYISCLGWPDSASQGEAKADKTLFEKFWPGVQVCGKDNLRQQSAIWQAMLMSAGLPNSKQVLVFGFISADGQKMSKSLGNVVDPYDLVEKYGTDPLRYCLLKEIKPFADSDFSESRFKDVYNADLANGLGNLRARVSNLLEKNQALVDLTPGNDDILRQRFEAEMDSYRFDLALDVLWSKIRETDELLTREKPWKNKNKEEANKVLIIAAQNILNISILLEPFMPKTADKIKQTFLKEHIKKGEPLFPRIS